MTTARLSRRALLRAGALALVAAPLAPAGRALAAPTAMHVMTDPGCSCCILSVRSPADTVAPRHKDCRRR